MLSDIYREIRLLTLAIEQSADRGKLERAAKFFQIKDVGDYAQEFGFGSVTPELTALIAELPVDNNYLWYRCYEKGASGSPEYRLAILLDELDHRIRAFAENACRPVSAHSLLNETLKSIEDSGNEEIQSDAAFLFGQFDELHKIRRLLENFPAISQYLAAFSPARHESLALIRLNREQNRDDSIGRLATLMLKVLSP